MRKSHYPWQLEIVPAVAVGTIAVYALRAWLDCNYWPPEDRELNRELIVTVVFACAMVSFLWLTEMGMNSIWARSERRKRFNWLVPLLQATMVINAFLAYCILEVLREWPFRAHVPGIGALAGVGVSAAAMSAVLEWRRKYVPREREPEPPPPHLLPERVDDGFSYREAHVDWWNAASACVWLVASVLVWFLDSFAWHSLTMLALVATCLAVGSHKVEVTSRTVRFRFGPIIKRFPLAEIQSCNLADHERFSKKRNKRFRILGANGPCVELELTSGRIYRLGALRPQYIVGLIGLFQHSRKDSHEPASELPR